jgi:hypothetical protein
MKRQKQTLTQTCSTVELEEALKVLEGRWKILILSHLFSAPVLRFSELRRAVSGISQKMLIQQLRGLEKDGISGSATQGGIHVDERWGGSSSGAQGAQILGGFAKNAVLGKEKAC